MSHVLFLDGWNRSMKQLKQNLKATEYLRLPSPSQLVEERRRNPPSPTLLIQKEWDRQLRLPSTSQLVEERKRNPPSPTLRIQKE